MVFLGYVLLGFAPGLFWLWYFRRKDDLEPEPRVRLIAVFLLGSAAAGALLLLQPLLGTFRPREPGMAREIVDILILTAFLEEAVKLLAFYLGAWRSKDLDEPLDGIVYGVAAALGFASVENVLYLVVTGNPGLIVARAFTATLGHVIFTGTMGFFFGVARFREGSRRVALMLVGFLLAVGLHAIYDLLLVPERGKLNLLSLLGLLPVGLILLGLKIRWSRARSARYHPELTE